MIYTACNEQNLQDIVDRSVEVSEGAGKCTPSLCSPTSTTCTGHVYAYRLVELENKQVNISGTVYTSKLTFMRAIL